jgi:hypothetical protein
MRQLDTSRGLLIIHNAAYRIRFVPSEMHVYTFNRSGRVAGKQPFNGGRVQPYSLLSSFARRLDRR